MTVLGTLCYGASSTVWAVENAGAESYIDFRKGNIPPEISVSKDAGQFLHPEQQGLRITIKDEFQGARPGLSLDTRLLGDFDITLTFEILEAQEPLDNSGYGVGILFVLAALNNNARIGCYTQHGGGQVVLWDLWNNPQRRWQPGGARPIHEKAGRLRFKRTGNTLQYLWSPEVAGDHFEPIHESNYPEEVQSLRLFAETNRQPRNLDVRLVDLRIRGGPVMAAEAGPSRTWLWIALLTMLGISMLAGWTYLRHKHRTQRMTVPAR